MVVGIQNLFNMMTRYNMVINGPLIPVTSQSPAEIAECERLSLVCIMHKIVSVRAYPWIILANWQLLRW